MTPQNVIQRKNSSKSTTSKIVFNLGSSIRCLYQKCPSSPPLLDFQCQQPFLCVERKWPEPCHSVSATAKARPCLYKAFSALYFLRYRHLRTQDSRASSDPKSLAHHCCAGWGGFASSLGEGHREHFTLHTSSSAGSKL